LIFKAAVNGCKQANVARLRIQAATVQRINALDAPIHASAPDAIGCRRQTKKSRNRPFRSPIQREALKNRLLK
jgi:hypothetical protein